MSLWIDLDMTFNISDRNPQGRPRSVNNTFKISILDILLFRMEICEADYVVG